MGFQGDVFHFSGLGVSDFEVYGLRVSIFGFQGLLGGGKEGLGARYRRGTRNHLGFVNEDNEGHTVVYKGRQSAQNFNRGLGYSVDIL